MIAIKDCPLDKMKKIANEAIGRVEEYELHEKTEMKRITRSLLWSALVCFCIAGIFVGIYILNYNEYMFICAMPALFFCGLSLVVYIQRKESFLQYTYNMNNLKKAVGNIMPSDNLYELDKALETTKKHVAKGSRSWLWNRRLYL